MSEKNYCVVLMEEGAAALKSVLQLWLSKSEMGFDYVYAKKIDPIAPYFHMHLLTPVEQVMIEVQIPHQYVKAVLYAEDRTTLGFLTSGEANKREGG